MPQLYKVIVLLFLYFCNILPVLASGPVPDKAGGTTGNGPYIAYEPVLDMRVTLYTGSERPETILEKLSEKTWLTFSYETTRLQHLPAFKASWKDERLADCLEQLLQGSGLVFIVNGKEIIIKRKSGSHAHTICGSICDDENGGTLMGVTLLMKDNATGTRSNAYGFYSLYLPAGRQRVGISCVGYETIDTVLNISHDEVLNIRMRPGLTGLGQVMRLLSNSLISSPTASWYPSNELLPVQSADNFSAGVYCSLARGKLQLAVNAYYKSLYDQTDYIDNANLQLNNLIDFEMLVDRKKNYYLITTTEPDGIPKPGEEEHFIVLDDSYIADGIASPELPSTSTYGTEQDAVTFEISIYSISEKAYTFYKSINRQQQSDGGLFKPLPYLPRGNFSGMTPAPLGFFLVAGVNTSRIVIHN